MVQGMGCEDVSTRDVDSRPRGPRGVAVLRRSCDVVVTRRGRDGQLGYAGYVVAQRRE